MNISGGQSELLSSVILVALVILIGVAGFFIVNGWASQQYRENMFHSFAELSLSEFRAYLVSVDNRSQDQYAYAYITLLRLGVIRDNIQVYVSAYNFSSMESYQKSLWSDAILAKPLSMRYNTINTTTAPGNYSIMGQATNVSIDPQRAYAKQGDAWWSLRDLGVSKSFTISSIGVIKQGDMVFLNITIPKNTAYIALVVWTQLNDRYIANPQLLTPSPP